VELVTSAFPYGPVPSADGYRVTEAFYRRAARRRISPRRRQALRLAEHPGDMLRHRRRARAADVVHYQWLPVAPLDVRLLAAARPRVLTAHDVLPREPRRGQVAATRRLARRMDAVVVHSEHGAERLRAEVGVDPERVHVIPHGAFDYLTALEHEVPLPAELAGVRGPVILCFGLIRPYKGIDVLLEAFASVRGAELWVVGMPRMPTAPLRRAAAGSPGKVRFVERFVTDAEIPAYFRRADVVVLPYREIDQSGVLYTALAFGKPLVLSRVGGFTELAERHGAARLAEPGDVRSLAGELNGLLGDPDARARLAAAAAAAAVGPYSWDTAAERTLALYRELLGR
jgi:glycosyltransferase involved in cell wall biosynthesis